MEMHCKARVAPIHYKTGNKGGLLYISQEPFLLFVSKSPQVAVLSCVWSQGILCRENVLSSTLNCLFAKWSHSFFHMLFSKLYVSVIQRFWENKYEASEVKDILSPKELISKTLWLQTWCMSKKNYHWETFSNTQYIFCLFRFGTNAQPWIIHTWIK